MNSRALPWLMGLLHGLNDAVAGCLLAMYSASGATTEQTVLAYLGYGLLAFGGQLPVGWWLDGLRRPKFVWNLSLFALAAAVCLSPLSLPAAILVSGLASALLHVSGATVCFLQEPRNTLAPGAFTAPGVLGLVLGGWLGHSGPGMQLLQLLLPVLAVSLVVARIPFPAYHKTHTEEPAPILEAHDLVMLVMLLAIALRSLIWNMLYLQAEGNAGYWLLAAGLAACAGKYFGGWACARWPWKRYMTFSLAAAAVLLSLGRDMFGAFLAGVFLLQGVVPVTLWALQRSLSRQPATAAGLALGTAIILAGLPTYLHEFRVLGEHKIFLPAALLLLFLLNGYWTLKVRNRRL